MSIDMSVCRLLVNSLIYQQDETTENLAFVSPIND